jgi:hypothetical protein
MVQRSQFVGLLRATEYNAQQANEARGTAAERAWALNTLLTAYSALESLVLETIFEWHPRLFPRLRELRSLSEKYLQLIGLESRSREPLPQVIAVLEAHRRTLTHDNPRHVPGIDDEKLATASAAIAVASDVRAVAAWLWKHKRPALASREFDAPNHYLA